MQAPEYALGGLRDPAQGVLVLTVTARDFGGSGLLSVTARLGGDTPVVEGFGDETCTAGSTATCPDTGTVELQVPTNSLPDGQHDLDLRVTDAAGNVSAKVERIITVRNTPAVYTSTVTVHVGSGVAVPPAPGGTAPPPRRHREQDRCANLPAASHDHRSVEQAVPPPAHRGPGPHGRQGVQVLRPGHVFGRQAAGQRPARASGRYLPSNRQAGAAKDVDEDRRPGSVSPSGCACTASATSSSACAGRGASSSRYGSAWR